MVLYFRLYFYWPIKKMFDQFVAAHDKPPSRLILDFDATDTPLHGDHKRGASSMATKIIQKARETWGGIIAKDGCAGVLTMSTFV